MASQHTGGLPARTQRRAGAQARSAGRLRLARAAPWLLWIATTAFLYWAALHTQGTYDTHRDAWVAEAITLGIAYPAAGPVIYQTFHLGPLWFYLVAALTPLLGAIPAVVLLSAATVAAAFPLAWWLGTLLGDRRFGLCLALLLAAPGWWLLQLGFLTHTAAVVAALLLVAALLVRFLQRPSGWRGLGLGASVALALHAHPTTLLLCGFAALVALVHGRRHGAPLPRLLLGLAAPTLLALLPYLLSPEFAADLVSTGRYAQSLGDAPTAWWRLPALLPAAWLGGGVLLARTWWMAPTGVAWLVTSLPWLLVGVLAVMAVRRRVLPGWRWRLAGALSLLLALQLLLLVLARPVTTPWMATTPWPLLAAIGALLLPPAGAWRGSGWQAVAAAALGVPVSVGLLVGMTRLGEWLPIATFPPDGPGMTDIASRPLGVERLHIVEYDLKDLGPLVLQGCSPVRVHGALAIVTARLIGMNWLAPCGNARHVHLGGSSPEATDRFAVWDEQTARACGTTVAALRRSNAITAFTVRAGSGFPLDALGVHPAPTTFLKSQAFERRFVASEPLLYVGNVVPDRLPLRVDAVLANGIPAEEVARTDSYSVYRCAACGAAPAQWQLAVETDPAALDVVSFDCPRPDAAADRPR